MNEQQLAFALAQLSASLQIATHQQEELQTLHQQLASSLIDEHISNVTANPFSFHTAEAFSPENLSQEQTNYFQQLAQQTLERSEKPTHRVFVRDVPVRSTQIKSSIPSWAAGAEVDKTIGPFLNKDGRRLWYDFYPLQELIALYIQGQTNPILLFHVSVFRKFLENISIVSDLKKTYNISGNTIWIYSQLLSPAAPAGYYTGLKIKGGVIELSEQPKLVSNHLTIAAATIVTIHLQLNQPEDTTADPTSDFGRDARNAKLNLPQQFNFHFSGNTAATIDLVSEAQWNLYGQDARFTWNAKHASFDTILHEIIIPLHYSETQFSVSKNLSALNVVAGNADVQWAAWALPVAQIDTAHPTAAEGIGALTIRCKQGLTTAWAGLQGGAVNLSNPYVQLNVEKISIVDLAAINLFGKQTYELWKDQLNPHRSSVELLFNSKFPFIYISASEGSEFIGAQTDANFQIDRPVTVAAQALDIRSRNSLLFISATKTLRLVYLYDDNILQDAYANQPNLFPKPISFALHNALFKVTPANGALLFGKLDKDFVRIEPATLFLTFGLYAYLPTLPDPYAAKLGVLKQQFAREGRLANVAGYGRQQIWLWLVCEIKWKKEPKDEDKVNVSFYFAPLQPQKQASASALTFTRRTSADAIKSQPVFQTSSFLEKFSPTQHADIAETSTANSSSEANVFQVEMAVQGLPDYQSIWDRYFGFLTNDVFALLDVSSHANQMGVSFAQPEATSRTDADRFELIQTFAIAAPNQNNFPLQVEGMDVVSKSVNVKAFTLPPISWEPVINLTAPQKAGDPPAGFNYYPNDGSATRFFNNSVKLVPIAPIPVTNALVRNYAHEPNNITAAYFTLPFGLRSLAFLYKTNQAQTQKPNITENRPLFANKIKGGIQLKLEAGSGFNEDENNQFRGLTLQINNVLNLLGNKTGASTLGYDVTTIFNSVFFEVTQPLDDMRGVPLTQFDMSGYGASIFSNWQNKDAEFADVSQAEFEVFVGRTAHEVIQVKSILYPWGIHVVRTITLFRVGSGYEYRYDSGWKAEDDGKFDFTFKLKDGTKVSPYEIHPGTVQGLFNVRNITSATDILPFIGSMDVNGFYDIDPATKKIIKYTGGTKPEPVNLQPVYFDADIAIENVVQGQVNGRVPSKKILGFVQLLPTGIPLTSKAFQQLLAYQNNSIGGPINCVVDIGKNGQQIRINRIDVNNSVDASNTNPVFVAAARGNVILPKEGSWSMVMHLAKTGEVIPLPEGVTVPLIRIGKLADDLSYPTNGLLRIANPTELLRLPNADTVNFGFLQSTNTQKALFLTPAYQALSSATAVGKLLSKTPPLFADAYRLMSSKGIFPNIGDAVNNYGDAIALAKNFATNAATDAGKQLLELMQINKKDVAGKVVQEGYKLLKQAENFDLSSLLDLTKPWYLINTSFLKIYIEYKADIRNGNVVPKKPDGSPDYHNPSSFNNASGLLNFDVDSFAANVADNWKSKLSNMAMVVDLGPLTRLVTIKGNFDAQNGAEPSYGGSGSNPAFPAPQVEFSEALDAVMEVLQILVDLQGSKYGDALKKGLKIAMSNSADSWQYKFDASKEIPVVKFPVPDDLYNNPNTPLKLQASLKLGVYFNETLQITTDPSQLLPTAGAYLNFYGQLSVMCVSLSVATVYAVGQVNLTIAADTKKGPSLDMKFGFGAQIVVGLPVVGDVSVLYMVGVGVYLDAKTVAVTASMLFQGNADLLEGLVDITITIEASGTVTRSGDQTSCTAEVTFAIDISIFLVIDISFSKSWSEQRQIA